MADPTNSRQAWANLRRCFLPLAVVVTVVIVVGYCFVHPRTSMANSTNSSQVWADLRQCFLSLAVAVMVVIMVGYGFTHPRCFLPCFFSIQCSNKKHQLKSDKQNTDMSSSASSSMIKRRRYDVFLSFRGEDTRNTFTSHLHKELHRKGIETFIDNDLRRGDEISPALLTAIEESKILVIVFSGDYASSKWCLDELEKIMDCKKRSEHYFVVPVFYGIDPSEVRNQRGSFAEAFAKHEEKFKDDIQKVKAWRTALTEAANLSGWDPQVTRPESTLVDEIVNDILKKLNHGTSSCSKGLVGIETRMERVMSLLCLGHSDFRKVGIWGMGGIGKTTLAGAIFNQISGDFQSSCFLEDVRDSEEREGLKQLRQKFFSTILEDRNLHVSTPRIPEGNLKDRLRRKKVLVVCDNVTNSMQLEYLFGGDVWLGSGSRLIITTRDRQVLDQNDIKDIYEVEELNGDESLQLFCQSAFKRNNLTRDQMQLSNTVLNFAKGNPLAIKVIGSSLFGMSEHDINSEVQRKLKQVPDPKIQELLRWSYDALDHEAQEIFLDIACFFRGEKRDRVTRIMNACYKAPNLGIKNLINKSLITVSEKNEIAMHDLLQEMGWDVVREESSDPEERSRLWDPEDIQYVLKEDFGTKTLKSRLIDMSRIQELELHPKAFANMRRLKFLKCSAGVSLPQGLLSLPDELRYLCWERYPLKTLPTKFCPRHLVELDMSFCRVEQLWDGKQDLPNLKVINLRHSASLIKIPDLSRATNLENLNLEFCKNLLELPSSVQYLEKLTHLDLTRCESLKSLPSLCKMRSLYLLFLRHCPNLIECPEISSNVSHLSLDGTAIEEVPSSIESLRKLQYLYVTGCSKLRNFPTAICHDRLSLSNSPNISTFPVLSGSIGQLYLDGTAIEEVPSSIASLSQLYLLRLSNCRRLRSISTSIHKLKSLYTLELDGCSRLEIFPEILDTMERLKELDLSETALKELPSSIENLIGLRELKLNNCKNLACLPDSFSKLKSLEDLYLIGCTDLVALPELPASLMRLFARDCTSLEEVTSPKNLFDQASLSTERSWVRKVWLFSNCYLLDRQAVGNLEISKSQMLFGHMVTLLEEHHHHHQDHHHQGSLPETEYITCVPGGEIPEFFYYKSVGASITIQLPSEWCNSRKSFSGFIASVVVSLPLEHFLIKCELSLKSCDGADCHDLGCSFDVWPGENFQPRLLGLNHLGSNHLFLLYKDLSRHFEGQGSDNCIYTEASFKFYPVFYDYDSLHWSQLDSCEVKMCGVHLLFGKDSDPNNQPPPKRLKYHS